MVDKIFGKQDEINPKNSKIEKLNSAIEIFNNFDTRWPLCQLHDVFGPKQQLFLRNETTRKTD